jgi:FixJ family two-component response regulator
MNGQVLYETLRESHPELLSRFVFITANFGVPEVRDFLHTVRVPFLEKPFRSAEVVHILERVLQASKN